MRSTVSTLFTIVVLVVIGQAHAADVGRVLLAAGDTVAVRDKQVVKLAFGSTIQDRDVLRTGPASNLQLRFTDESILSMRENSEVRIDEFRFTGKEDGSERAFFSLVKGGLRKITGIIGRINNKNYQMSTAVATIGIRGTHYLATMCQQDCRNPDGTLAKDGLYGLPIAASSTSKNSVTNATGEHIFGIGQPYYAQDFDTRPQLLLEPPGLLSVAVKSKSTKPPAGTGTEQAAAGGTQQDARGTTPPPPSVVLPRLLAGSSPTTDSFLDPVSAATTGASPETAVVAARIPDTGNGGIANFGGVQCPSSPSCGQAIVNASLSADAQGQQLTAFNDGSITGMRGSGGAMDVGSNAAAGNLHWGVWPSGMVNGSPIAFLHYIVGDVPSLPGTGTFTYSPVGGTQPTNGKTTGSFLGGNVLVDFQFRQLSVNKLTIGFNSAIYTMNSPTMQPFQSNGTFGASLSGTCSGACGGATSPPGGSYAGSFVGANAPGLGMVYGVFTGGSNGDIIGAQGFKR